MDDALRLREAIARSLRAHGCDVQTAAHGLEGLDQLAHDDFDAVVSDIQMPVMDGLAFRRHALARDPSLRHRFILCSAMPLDARNVEPPVHFLRKPFTGTDLWGTLSRLLGAPSSESSPEAIDSD